MRVPALQREAAAQQGGASSLAPAAEAALLVERMVGEEPLQRRGRRRRVVAEPVPPAGWQHDQVAGRELPLGDVALDLEPATAGGDHVEGGGPVRVGSEPPWR